jgi:hypothetical protein
MSDITPEIRFTKTAEPEAVSLINRFQEAATGFNTELIEAIMLIAEKFPGAISLASKISAEPGKTIEVLSLWREIIDPVSEPWRAIEGFDDTTTELANKRLRELAFANPVKVSGAAMRPHRNAFGKETSPNESQTIKKPDKAAEIQRRRIITATFVGRLTAAAA